MDSELKMQRAIANMEQHLDEISYSLKELVKLEKNKQTRLQIYTTDSEKEEQKNEGEY